LIPARWGEGGALSLGVEEEVMLLDAETLEPAPAVAAVLAAQDARPLPGQLKTELHASVVELNTDVCRSAAEALASVRALRAAADDAARANGLRIAAAGAHPTTAVSAMAVANTCRFITLPLALAREACA